MVPPFLTPGDTWFIEVTATGLTNYTITSLPITLERPVWTMPLGHNTTFGDSGNDSGGNPLPGDRGLDITVPPGNNSDGLETHGAFLRTWYSDSKNQGPYSSPGQDAAGTYPFNTPPLRPGHTYYVGFRAASDATFSFSSSTTGSIGSQPDLDFFTGAINTSVPAGTSVLYRIPAPPEATRMKWTATHPGTVQLRLEQGTLPGTTGSQHWTSGSTANAALNFALTPSIWPWQPNQYYYLRVVNTSASAQTLVLTMNGKNAATEDEDADGLPDAWEKQYFPSIGTTNGSSDPDLDGLDNIIEFAFGLIPTSGASVQLPQAQQVGGNFVTSFIAPATIAGIIYGAEWSTTLAPGSWTTIPDTGLPPQHTFSIPIGSRPGMFMRLKVTNP